MKKYMSSAVGRVLTIVLLLLVQIAAITVMFNLFGSYYIYFQAVCIAGSAVAVVYILNSGSNPAYKIAWIILIMLLPIFGGLFYVLFGRGKLSKREIRRTTSAAADYDRGLLPAASAMDALAQESPDAAIESRYILTATGVPPYGHTETTYCASGEVMFRHMIEEIEKAQKFIFLEFFIIHEGRMWNEILALLEKKVAAGVEVRLIYDDFGCLMTLPSDYRRILEAKGIRTCVFNVLKPALTGRLNNRDHRKILVIDGNVGFTGGVNLADEYINEKVRFGHWQDSGVMLRGDAVLSLTVMFLAMWDSIRPETDDFAAYVPDGEFVRAMQPDGFVQPFTDTPLDDEPVGETVYLNIINRAKKYVYICTPYLIIDNEMITALTTAAKCGIDVRIMTPHIPDKRIVFAMTRSYYRVLLRAGVRIFEYTPGFLHSKSFVCDDEYAVVGTINLDFRSLFLHYECAAWMFRSSCVLPMKEDYLSTLDRCQEVDLEWYSRRPLFSRAVGWLFRIFAPLL